MNILLATNGSECSDGAARFLARLHVTARDLITVLHVIPGAPAGRAEAALAFREIRNRIAPRIVEESLRILRKTGARLEISIAAGAPDRALMDTAALMGGEALIVMGVRGVRGIERFFTGSITRSVANGAAVPVLVVKRPQWSDSGALRILCAVDGSEAARGAVRLLRELPFAVGTELTVLAVSDTAYLDIPDRYVNEVDEHMKQIVAGMAAEQLDAATAVAREARELLAERHPGVRELVLVGSPADTIVHRVETERADLVVLGGSGLRGHAAGLGSVARNVLNHAGSSVLIGRQAA